MTGALYRFSLWVYYLTCLGLKYAREVPKAVPKGTPDGDTKLPGDVRPPPLGGLWFSGIAGSPEALRAVLPPLCPVPAARAATPPVQA